MKKIFLADVVEEGVSHDPEIRKQVLLKKGDVPHLTNFSRGRLLPGQAATAHTHPNMFEVFFVESGQGIIRVDQSKQEVQAGVCVVAEPGEEHEIINTGPSELVLFYFGIER